MNRLKISTRLSILIGILSLLLAAIGGIGLYGIRQSNEALRVAHAERLQSTERVAEIQKFLLRNRLAIAVALVTPDAETIRASIAEIEANILAIDKVWSAYMATSMSAEEVRLTTAFAGHRANFVRQGLRPVVAAFRADDLDEARRLVLHSIRPLYAPVNEDIDALLKFQRDSARTDYLAALQRYATIRLVAIASIVLGLLFAVLFGAALIRGIARALKQAVEVAMAVARGQLNHAIRADGNDEVAELLSALALMQEKLNRVVSDVRADSESVAAASAQIASGNHDLSARTVQQAGALEETAASIEELSATVRQNAENAARANQLAQNAGSTAQQGGEVVARVVATMQGINASSRKIADIIGVIDSIAFQTNILALNAAVEAARAGAQGRGFAVVATEVRNLAGRSAEAAREIKNLIHASVGQVENGTQLVDQAGATMSEIVAAVQRVTDLMSEISVASREQSQGVTQVAQAIVQMDNATQQNALLVEEMANAAGSLNAQSQNLVDTVALFRLAQDEARSGGQAPPAMVLLASTAVDSAAEECGIIAVAAYGNERSLA